MKKIFIIPIVIIFISGCTETPLQLSEYDRKNGITEEIILNDIKLIRVGMNINEAAKYLVPNSNSSPSWKNMGDGRIKYYFLVGENKQITLDVETPNELLPKSPIMPNGEVVKVGKLEDKGEWVFKYSDSNELK